MVSVRALVRLHANDSGGSSLVFTAAFAGTIAMSVLPMGVSRKFDGTGPHDTIQWNVLNYDNYRRTDGPIRPRNRVMSRNGTERVDQITLRVMVLDDGLSQPQFVHCWRGEL